MTLAGIVILSILERRNAEDPIVVTLFGIVTLVDEPV
jgi:hypothetical protein